MCYYRVTKKKKICHCKLVYVLKTLIAHYFPVNMPEQCYKETNIAIFWNCLKKQILPYSSVTKSKGSIA